MLKFKLDHNIPKRAKSYLQDQFGHDVETAFDENLHEATDPDLLEETKLEERVLITLDKGFIDPLRYKKSDYYGIIHLNLHKADRIHVIDAIHSILTNLPENSFPGRRTLYIETGVSYESYLIYSLNY